MIKYVIKYGSGVLFCIFIIVVIFGVSERYKGLRKSKKTERDCPEIEKFDPKTLPCGVAVNGDDGDHIVIRQFDGVIVRAEVPEYYWRYVQVGDTVGDCAGQIEMDDEYGY